MNGGGHFIRLGRCGHVIAQCRCMGPKTVEHVDELCYDCARLIAENNATATEWKPPKIDAT